MNRSAIQSIVIVGGGTSGWMCAAALSEALQRSVSIHLIESDDIGTIGVGEATIPALHTFNDQLRIPEVEFVKAVKGTFKLGIEFKDWGKLGESYIHGFGHLGHDYGSHPFHQLWLREALQGQASHLDDYSLHSVAARHMKFMTSARDVPANSPLANIAHAYHFDAGLYAKFLRQYSEARGVTRVEGKIIEVKQRASDGHVESVLLNDQREIKGQLWIDCSGLHALLIDKTIHVPFIDWSHWLPADRAVAVACEKVGPATPYTRSTTRPGGWQWRIPLQHRTGNGYVFSSAHLSEDEATATLLANLDGKPLGDPRVIKFKTGHRAQFWDRNVVAIGLSSGFMEPLESTSIYLIQSGIGRLLNLLPRSDFSPTLIQRYNDQAIFEFTRIRDFLILHYHATTRDDTSFWQYCKHMSTPDSLRETIELFRDSGRFYRNGDEMFALTSWVQVLVGQGIVPKAYHPAVDVLPTTEVHAVVENAKKVIANCVAAMPTHEQFIERHCKA